MNLNLGCSNVKGQYRDPIWINVDILSFTGVNVKGSASELPFKDNSFDKIHFVHSLEHLTRDKHIPVFKECHRVLKPGGSLFLEVPDGPAVIELLHNAYKNNDRHQIHIWTTSCFGKTERRFMAHHFAFDYGKLEELSNAVGFKSVKRLIDQNDMISNHVFQEPVILIKATK